jgi:hypothetical protein
VTVLKGWNGGRPWEMLYFWTRGDVKPYVKPEEWERSCLPKSSAPAHMQLILP